MGNQASSTTSALTSDPYSDPPPPPPPSNGAHAKTSNGSSKSPLRHLSSGSIGSEVSSATPIPSLHGSMIRSQRDRDPLRYYEIIMIMGEGSMGNVAKVRKRSHVVGGSARPQYVQQQKPCFFWRSIFCPPQPTFTTEESLASSSQHDTGAISPSDTTHSWLKSSEGAPSNASSSNSPKPTSSWKLLQRRTNSTPKKQLDHSPSSLITFGHKDIHYALKSIHLNRISNPSFLAELKNEIDLLKELDHPNIVKAIETFDYNNQVFLVLELCSGGDLYTRDPYTEQQAARITNSILSAVAYIHSKQIVHRDLKFENIMFANPNSYAVKIIDFGLSKKYGDKRQMKDTVGTCYTFAPEVIKGSYTNKADLWSAGVIVFMLLSSSMPFYGKDRRHMLHRILKQKYAFKGRRWRYVSADAKRFVSSLLVQADQRPSAETALADPWLSRQFNKSGQAPEVVSQLDTVQATIQTFSDYGKLKKLALMVIAHRSTNEQIGFLRFLFRNFDTLKDGEISYPEFVQALSNYEYTEAELQKLFHAIDIDGTGIIHYSEFLAATIEAHGSLDEERLAEAFDRLDTDDSGYITKQDLREFLGKDIPEEYLDEVMEEADLDCDRKISYEEFLAMWDEEYDVKRKNALVDVGHRKKQPSNMSAMTFDSTDDLLSVSDLSSSDGMPSPLPSEETPMSADATSFFRTEKAKSIRIMESQRAITSQRIGTAS